MNRRSILFQIVGTATGMLGTALAGLILGYVLGYVNGAADEKVVQRMATQMLLEDFTNRMRR